MSSARRRLKDLDTSSEASQYYTAFFARPILIDLTKSNSLSIADATAVIEQRAAVGGMLMKRSGSIIVLAWLLMLPLRDDYYGHYSHKCYPEARFRGKVGEKPDSPISHLVPVPLCEKEKGLTTSALSEYIS